ncbi:MAG: NAD(P)H-dependent oxidoreductase, partial [Chthoniobacteraceae bacterium]
MSKRVLILFAHPALEKSRVHRRLAAAVRDLPGVTFRDLYECYPDLHIDAEAEQALLSGHDAIIFQHPFYWYSSPAIVKEWQDVVLQYGFAYGEGGTALRGQTMITVLSTGGPEDS